MIYEGIDLGGTTIKAGLVTEDGKILAKKSIPTGAERPSRDIVLDMAYLSKDLIQSQGLALDEVASIGIGSPGTIDTQKGEVVFANNFADFHHVPVASIMKEVVPVPVYLDNDANVAALGESLFGAGKGSANSVLITLGTGLGGGIIIDGKILTGFYAGGGEVGHQVIVADGEPCTCGRRGCWETYSAATALIRMGKKYANEDPSSLLNQMEGGDLALLNAKDVFDALDQGDQAAVKAFQEYCHYLGIGIANMINLFQPEFFIIGGGPSAQGDKLLKPVEAEVKKQVYGGTLHTKIVTAQLGNDAGIIGAAMLGKTR